MNKIIVMEKCVMLLLFLGFVDGRWFELQSGQVKDLILPWLAFTI